MFIRNQRGMVLYNTDNLISISVEEYSFIMMIMQSRLMKIQSSWVPMRAGKGPRVSWMIKILCKPRPDDRRAG